MFVVFCLFSYFLFFACLGEDINEGAQELLDYIENGSSLSDKNVTDLWVGYITAYENKESVKANEDSDILEKIKSFIAKYTKQRDDNNNNNDTKTPDGNLENMEEPTTKRQSSKTSKTESMLATSITGGDEIKTAEPGDMSEKQQSIEMEMEVEELSKIYPFVNGQTVRWKRTFLHLLCLKEHHKNIFDQFMTQFNKSINFETLDKNSNTVLHYSLKNQSEHMSKSLISNENLDINYINNNNESYLHYTVLYSTNEHISLLFLTSSDDDDDNNNNVHVPRMPNVNLVDGLGNSVLHYSYIKVAFLQQLLVVCRNNINVNIHNKYIENKQSFGVTPIFNFLSFGNNNIALQLLLKFDKDNKLNGSNNNDNEIRYNETDAHGNSILHYSMVIFKPQSQYVERPNYHTYLLLNNREIGYQALNMDVNAYNKEEVGGDTPLHLNFKNMYNITSIPSIFSNSNNDAVKNYSSMAQHSIENVQLLLNNPNINIYTQSLKSGDTCVHYATHLYQFQQYHRHSGLFEHQKLKLEMVLSRDALSKNKNTSLLNMRNRYNQTPSDIANGQRNSWNDRIGHCQEQIRINKEELARTRAQLRVKQQELNAQKRVYDRARSDYESAKRRVESVESRMNNAQREYQSAESDYQSKLSRYNDPNDTSVRSMPSRSNLDYKKRNYESLQRDYQNEMNRFRPIENQYQIEKSKYEQIEREVRELERQVSHLESQVRMWENELMIARSQYRKSNEIIDVLRKSYNYIVNAPHHLMMNHYNIDYYVNYGNFNNNSNNNNFNNANSNVNVGNNSNLVLVNVAEMKTDNVSPEQVEGPGFEQKQPDVALVPVVAIPPMAPPQAAAVASVNQVFNVTITYLPKHDKNKIVFSNMNGNDTTLWMLYTNILLERNNLVTKDNINNNSNGIPFGFLVENTNFKFGENEFGLSLNQIYSTMMLANGNGNDSSNEGGTIELQLCLYNLATGALYEQGLPIGWRKGTTNAGKVFYINDSLSEHFLNFVVCCNCCLLILCFNVDNVLYVERKVQHGKIQDCQNLVINVLKK